jgi:FkbM family methyltransferase
MNDVLTPGDCVLYVGANLGLVTVHAARLVGESGLVIAMEPAARPLKLLEANIEINELQNVRIVRKGAAAVAGEVGLFHDSHVGAGGSTMLGDGNRKPDEKVQVETIDAILAEIHHPPVRFVQLDVEGFELDALRGASSLLGGDDPPIVCMEYTHHQRNSAVAADLLVRGLNFRRHAHRAQ